MGKLGPRLSTKKKAKRWKKGQSASSNPTIKKHRDQARNAFFQPLPGFSSLTIEAVQGHDRTHGNKPRVDQIDESVADSSTFKTSNTFASDFSNCSNVSFDRFLDHYQNDSIIHKEMLALLAAITSVIKENGGKESSTEYYAALMTALGAARTDESVVAIISLLSMGMKTVPKNVLKQQFGQASQVFVQILMKYIQEEHFLILRHCINCLSILLRYQESAAWTNSSTVHILDAILVFTTHSKPKLRKAAHYAICSILKGSDVIKDDNTPMYHPAASYIGKHFLAFLEAAGKPGQVTSTLHILSLLKEVVHYFPKTTVKSICEGLLSIMTLNNILVTSCCLQTLHGLFVSKPTEATLPSQLNAQIINALYDYQPGPSDAQPTLAWLAVMQEAHCNLVVHDPELCAANIPRIIEKCTELWLSDKTEVVAGASHTLKALFETCISTLCDNKEISIRCKPALVKTIKLIQEGLKYQYNTAWHHVIHLLASLFKIIGPICKTELVQVLVTISELRDSNKFTYNAEIEYTVGAAVKSLGPEIVLSAVPLQSSTGEVDLKRSWLLPVLKDCTSNATLGYFIDYLLPLAESCWQKYTILKEKKDCIEAHSNELLSSQIYALLPSFCNNPPDIKKNFIRIAKTLGTIINERKDLRLSVMSSLRKLIQKSIENNNQEDINELTKFAKNYLPLLFNIYTNKVQGSDEEGQRLACFETIKVYLKITPIELVGELFDKALENLNSPESTDFLKESIFDLVRVLCPYTDISRVQMLYEKCLPLLENKENQKEQKKAYRFLEEICKSESVVCQEFVNANRKQIQKAIIKSASAVHKPSKGTRIRCIISLVEKHPQLEKTKFLKAIIPEAVMCLKEINEKCRSSAFTLLNTIAEKFVNKEEYFKEYIDTLLFGLECTSIYCSTTLLALTSIMYHYNGVLEVKTVQKILNFICDILTESSREIILSALSFIKVYISVIPSPVIAPVLNKIIHGLSSMTEDSKRHFRQKVRDILVKLVRKFGIETITAMVSSSDTIMHRRLKNIRKIETRKQKIKEQKKTDNNDESLQEFNVNRKPKSLEDILADSDEEFDDTDDEKSVKSHKQKKMWLKESNDNIVNFIDPTAAKNISVTKPSNSNDDVIKATNKNHGFKTASDGRLVIVDDSDSDTVGEVKRTKKNKLFDKVTDDYFASDNESEDSKTIKSSNKTVQKRKLTSDYQTGGSGIHRPIKKIKKELEPGEEYRSKKGFGDIKRKGKPDPYAYIPLKRSALNRRNKAKEHKVFKNLLCNKKKNKKITKKFQKNKIIPHSTSGTAET